MAHYSAAMFTNSIQDEIPVRKSQGKNSQGSSVGSDARNSIELKRKLRDGTDIGRLTPDAVETLVRSVQGTNVETASFKDILCRSSLLLCCKSKKLRFRERVSEQFDASLDIRSFLSM